MIIIIMRKFIGIYVVLFAGFTSADVIYDTKLGKIRGLELTTPNGTTFHAFLGIPFAKPPTGQLRFQAPQPYGSWDGTLNATKDTNICYSTTTESPTESEDCLYLNVFVPLLNSESADNLPVQFSIYGGAFRSGSITYVNGGPEWMLEQGVVFVAPNYRLGPFGFLSTGDTVIPGNAGLKDQHLALKWTYDNIASFGGDPDKIVITGQSAGGASVGFHLLSKKSAGLFRGAIVESGSPLCGWAFRSNPKSYVISLAKAINATINSTESSEFLLEYLQGIDSDVIDNVSSKLILPLPVVEAEHNEAFVTEPFYEIFASGDVNKVPLLIGFNSEEEIGIGKDLVSLEASCAKYDANHYLLTPSGMEKEYSEYIADVIATLYIGNSTFSDIPGKFIRHSSDTTFIRPVIRQAKMYSNYSDVYLYRFNYDGKMGNINIIVEGADRVGHGEETKYLSVVRNKVYDNTIDENFPESDLITRARMIKMWSNFIKYLNPTPEKDDILQNVTWPLTHPSDFKYLEIDVDLTVKTNPQGDYYSVWEKMYDTYGIRPFYTY